MAFLFSKTRGAFVDRKFRHNGLYELRYLDDPVDEEDEENLPPTPVNLTNDRIVALDQVDEEESFFIKRVRSNFLVNDVFIASVSLRQIKEKGVYQNHNFVVKKLNYWH